MKNMENLTPKEINLDFYNKKTVTVNAKQYDKHSRYLLVTCYNHGSLFLLNNASYSAYIRYKKADELSVFQSCEITDDGKILIELTEQMLLVAGTCMADLLIVDEGTLSTDTDIPVITNDGNTIYISESSILSTMNFYINVSSSPLQNQDIESTSEFSALNDMLEKVHDSYAHVMENAEENADKAERFMAQASKKADEADQSSKLSQSYAIGTNNEVREADSVDNAKYYYEQSKQIQDEVHKVAEGDLLINTASFTEADSRENIESGETLGTLFGKIKKWFSSLGTAAFHNVSNSLTQTSDGYVADARAVNNLATRVGELNNLATTAKESIVEAINENYIKISESLSKADFNSWKPIQTISNVLIDISDYPLVQVGSYYEHKNMEIYSNTLRRSYDSKILLLEVECSGVSYIPVYKGYKSTVTPLVRLFNIVDNNTDNSLAFYEAYFKIDTSSETGIKVTYTKAHKLSKQHNSSTTIWQKTSFEDGDNAPIKLIRIIGIDYGF